MIFADSRRRYDELMHTAWLVQTVRAVAGDSSVPSSLEALIGPRPTRAEE